MDAGEGLQVPGEGLQVPGEGLQVPEEAAEASQTLPTLGALEVTVETPSHRAVELREPQAPAGVTGAAGAGAGVTGAAGAGAGVQPPAGLKEVYRQGEAQERQLRKQNIIQVADGSYLQARPDGVGGVELVPVARALQKRD